MPQALCRWGIGITFQREVTQEETGIRFFGNGTETAIAMNTGGDIAHSEVPSCAKPETEHRTKRRSISRELPAAPIESF